MSLSISLLRQIIRESLSRPKIYVLVGPQGVGKSYWVEQNVSDPYIISYDKVVDIVRKPLGLKYDEIAGPRAGAHRKEIERLHKDNVKGASASSKDIVVDMTNMGSKARRRALAVIQGREDDYEKIAVFFDYRGMEELVQQSVEKRAAELDDKHLSRKIIEDTLARFEMPTREEGFDDIIIVDPSETLNRP
jgi:predicted kinase